MISWEELRLAQPEMLKFPDRRTGVLHVRSQSMPLQSRPREYALLKMDRDTQVELDDCVDTSPNYEAPWVLVVSGQPQDRVLLFGGELIYVVSSDARIQSQTPAFRERRNAQFWRTKIVPLDNESILIDYERGALVVESTLEIRWHVEKALIDFFDHRDGTSLIFLRDHETPFSVDIATGSGVPEITSMSDITSLQKDLCTARGYEYVPVSLDSMLGFAAKTQGQTPVNGLRHAPTGDTNGWYVWCGQELSQEPDFFDPLHTQHLLERCPEAIRFLALPPGCRFFVAGDYVDVWFDESLLK